MTAAVRSPQDQRRPPPPVHEAAHSDRFRSPRWWARVVLLAVLVWGLSTAWTIQRAAFDLAAARAAIGAAEAAWRAGDLPAAETPLADARASADAAATRLGSLRLLPLRALPIAGPNLGASRALAVAARDVTAAAGDLVGRADGLLRPGEDGAELGELGLERVRDLVAPLRATLGALDDGIRTVQGSGSPQLLGPVEEARAGFLVLAEPLLERGAVVADAAEALPGLLGADGPRRYLVGAGSLSELRGTGGLIGSFSVATVRVGRMRFEDFVGIDEIERGATQPAVAAPSAAYADRYGRLGGTRFWRNANLSSDGQLTADVLLTMWEGTEREPVDGVILADTVAFERLLERAGPVDLPDGTTMEPGDVREFVGLEAYGAFASQDERKLVLGAVAAAAFGRVAALSDGGDLMETVALFGSLARDGHLQVNSVHPREEAALRRAGATGALPDVDGEFAAVIVNNVAANKVDYFTSRTINHHVRLSSDGATTADVTVRFTNDAPTSGFPQYVLGPNADGLSAGDNLSLVTLLCGQRCRVTAAPGAATEAGTDRGLPATDLRLRVPAGTRQDLRYRTRTDRGWEAIAGGVELTVRHRRQPTVTDDTYVVTVEVPEGTTAVTIPEGAVVRGDVVVWEPVDDRSDVALRYRFEPT